MAELNGTPASLETLQQLALVNYGHFTSMRIDDGHVRGLDLHMQRLARDCRIVFGTDLDTDQVRSYVRQAVAGRAGTFVTRVTIFDPALDMGHPGAPATPSILVTTREIPATMPPAPMSVRSFEFTRDTPQVKHIGLFGQLRLRREAQLAGAGDALFHEPDGRISEGGTWNVAFIDENDTVVWPQADVLPGVTMHLLQAAYENTVTAPVTLEDLPRMRAAIATNTSIGARAISAVDDIEFATDHPVVTTLQKLFADMRGEKL